MIFTLIITFILILLITVFGFQNGAPVDVKFLFWNVHTSLIAIVFGSGIVGAAIVAFLTIPKLVSKHLNERRLTKKLNNVAKPDASESSDTSPLG